MNKLIMSILASAGLSLAMVPAAQAEGGYCGGNIPQYQAYCQNIVNPNVCAANAAYCSWVQPTAPVYPGYPGYPTPPPPPYPGYPPYPGHPPYPGRPGYPGYGPRPGWGPWRPGWGHDRGHDGWGHGGWGRGGDRGPGGDRNGARVCFFIDVNYGGGQMCLAPGQVVQNLATVNGWNDKISAIQIQGRASATVCSDAYFQGSCATVSSSMPALWNLNGRNFNDVISSIRVQ